MIELPPRYSQIVEAFGDGGMSEAFRCKDDHLDRDVVVKALRAGVEPRRILAEINSLSAIRSKHVVQLYDVIFDRKGKMVAVVEEYVPGLDLTDVPTPDDSIDALEILYPIAAGINEIHKHGCVHRDIKPNNMKYDSDGTLKIFDFGLSKVGSTAGSTTTVAFTPGYAAPELFKMHKGTVNFTAAVDTFAFGATALELLRGDLPDQLNQTPPDLPCAEADFGGLPQGLPANICQLLNACLSADPNDRPLMEAVVSGIARELLHDEHSALLTYAGTTRFLDNDNPVARLRAGELGAIEVTYDGYDFKVTALEGEIYINNMRIAPGFILPGSCVIVMGAPALGMRRASITFDVSRPEIVL